jgi:hypothetical protein
VTAVVLAVAMVGCTIAMTLSGARVYAVNAVLVVVWTVVLSRGAPIRPATYGLMALVVLLPAVVLSALREGGASGLSDLFYRVFIGGILRRVFIDPVDVGSWFLHYAQTTGELGIGAVPRLAVLFGVEPIQAGNVIGLLYAPYTLDSVNAGAGFVFSYYGYFGLVAFPLALAGLWLLDLAVPILASLRPALVLPTLAATAVATLAFMSADYTVGVVSHGFGMVLVTAVALDRVLRWRGVREFSAPPTPLGALSVSERGLG